MIIKLKKSMLIGNQVYSKGEAVEVEDGKGKTLLAQGFAEETDNPAKVKAKQDPAGGTNQDDDDPENDEQSQAAYTSFFEAGIDQKSAELLVKAGVKSIEEIRAHKDLTKIKGIGKASAEKILEAIA